MSPDLVQLNCRKFSIQKIVIMGVELISPPFCGGASSRSAKLLSYYIYVCNIFINIYRLIILKKKTIVKVIPTGKKIHKIKVL